MMRAIVLLALLSVGSAADMEKEGSCVLDGAEAANELVDATIYIWAAVKRCDGKHEALHCEVDITSALESVQSMINIILRAVEKCGRLNTVNRKCGLASSRLTESMAGIAAASGGIIQKCPNDMHVTHTEHCACAKGTPGCSCAHKWSHDNKAMCVVDLKDSMKSLMKSIVYITKLKKTSEDGGAMTGNALGLVAALAGLGEYVAGAVGHCSHKAVMIECGSAISELIKDLTKLAEAGAAMKTVCAPTEGVVPLTAPERLYENKAAAAAGSTPNFVLAAFLPIAAVVSFVGGRYYAGRQHQNRGTRVLSMEQADIGIE